MITDIHPRTTLATLRRDYTEKEIQEGERPLLTVPVYLPIAALSHHLGVFGRTGCGKSNLMMVPGRCIALSTKAGDLVLDPFMGSGTTSIAAELLGRKSIGFDVAKAYVETARKRVARAAAVREGTKCRPCL